jgi:hypothetical protein
LTWGGEFLLHNNEFVLNGGNVTNCCCPEGCCACERLNFLTCVHLELTGGITDSLDLTGLLLAGICGAWRATKDLGGACSGEWINSELLLECDDESSAADAVKFSIIPDGAECATSDFVLDEINCTEPFSAVFSATLIELVPGGCDACGGEGATVTATFSEC